MNRTVMTIMLVLFSKTCGSLEQGNTGVGGGGGGGEKNKNKVKVTATEVAQTDGSEQNCTIKANYIHGRDEQKQYGCGGVGVWGREEGGEEEKNKCRMTWGKREENTQSAHIKKTDQGCRNLQSS